MAKKTGSSSSKQEKSAGERQYSDKTGVAYIDGMTFRSKAVQYVEVDGMAMVEGDILLGSVEQVQERTSMRAKEIAGEAVAAGVAISGSQFRWPNCTIPYQISSDLSNQDRVTDAIAHWEANTNFRFVLRTPANEAQYPDWVEFVPGGGCASFVGRQGGRQTVTLASGCSTGNCIHEIGHVVGLWHEQSREDRDAFVTIQFANIIPAAVSNFSQHITDGDDLGAYDYDSIMHYPRKAFSANGQDTIVPTDPSADIGQRNGLSPGDVAAANVLCRRIPPLTLPPTRPTFTPPTRPTLPTFPTRPTLTPPTRPTLTPPTRPTFTPPTRPTFTPPTRPTLPTFPTRPTLTPPTRPTFTPPTRPTFTPPTRPTFTPPTRPTFTPPTRPTLTPPTRPTILTPPTRPTIFTPPTRPTIFTPPTRPTLPGTIVPGTIQPRVGFGDPWGYQGYYDPYSYDPYGYDPYGYDPYGYDPYGYDPYGHGGYYDPYGYGATGYESYYDPYGYGATGYESYYDPNAYGYTGYEDPYGHEAPGYGDPYSGGSEDYYDPYGTGETEYEGYYDGYSDPYGYGY